MSLSPTRPVSASLRLCYYYCTIAQPAGRPDVFGFVIVVVVVSRGHPLRHLELNTDSSASPEKDGFEFVLSTALAHGHAEGSATACDASV